MYFQQIQLNAAQFRYLFTHILCICSMYFDSCHCIKLSLCWGCVQFHAFIYSRKKKSDSNPNISFRLPKSVFTFFCKCLQNQFGKTQLDAHSIWASNATSSILVFFGQILGKKIITPRGHRFINSMLICCVPFLRISSNLRMFWIDWIIPAQLVAWRDRTLKLK